MEEAQQVSYYFNKNDYFSIKNYNQSKPFSNFFPGIAGLWGIPMWVFYVNRGQCITSFGIESKDKAIMEFQPANKAYRLTAIQGFRTFIKVKFDKKTIYWEPFQDNLSGTDFKKTQKMSMSPHDLTIEETNEDLGLTVNVNYFTLPEEPYSGLVRKLSIKNNTSKKCQLDVIDGLPMIVPYGLNDWLAKNLSRTVEAWVKVRNIDQKAPFYQLNVEVSDTPEVKYIKDGNFFFSFSPDKEKTLLDPIVEASVVFGHECDFKAPVNFVKKDFCLPDRQQTSNRTPAAFSRHTATVEPKKKTQVVSMFGYAHDVDQLNHIVDVVLNDGFIERKALRNKEIIREIQNFALTKSSSNELDLYCQHTFMDNILRGGLPVSLKTSDGNIAFNVYSRKHGDIERDYNYFLVSPTYYSQGNGNYRDVNQNRRNDVWFNTDVKDNHLIDFLNLIQADGYNPLVVLGTSFSVVDMGVVETILKEYVDPKHHDILKEFFQKSFMPGELLTFISHHDIKVKGDPRNFLGRVLEICQKEQCANHGEGFWSDHWTYNMDTIESYLSLYPENLKKLLLDEKNFTFYQNDHYVLPRDQRYILTDKGVRQYKSVAKPEEENKVSQPCHQLRTKHGEGNVYQTNLAVKLLCLIANKAATLDPSGIGIEMEADKPNWYDALNGLPGRLGSSVSETFELKRYALFLLESLKQLRVSDKTEIKIFKELATFISGLTNVLSMEGDALSYWMKTNDIKELYRQLVRQGIEGEETKLSVLEIKQFLELVIKKTDQAKELAQKDKDGFIATYFYHDVTDYEILDKSKGESMPFVRPIAFKRHALPLFLEGNVHALKCEFEIEKRRQIYRQVRESDLYDQKLKMYKVNTDLSGETEEIGRTRIFPRGWLENESIWLHMEYKFMLELIKGELYEEFYENFQNVLIPFLKPKIYGRSILENSSFLVSSAHEDTALHGRGFVARLSGSTAELLHIWLIMNVGRKPFSLNPDGQLILQFDPILQGWMFTEKESTLEYLNAQDQWQTIDLPKNVYAFNFLGNTLVVYHNPKRKNTYGPKKTEVSKVELFYSQKKNPVVVNSAVIPAKYAVDIRQHKVQRIDVHFS